MNGRIAPVCSQCGMPLGSAPVFFGVPTLCSICALSWTGDDTLASDIAGPVHTIDEACEPLAAEPDWVS